mmetsp:Transcript_11133/g.15340  ORF Transcript_11133/g.15340 Transcript_11133/m.15340 type:complete len:243 (-) Transcript_11133:97-825(-)
MIRSLSFFVLSIFLLHSNIRGESQTVEESVNIIYRLYHSFDGHSFSLRSRIQLKPKADGQYQFVFLDKNSISGNNINDFKNLLNTNDLYQIKIQSSTGEQTSSVLSSLPACELQKSGFKEDLLIYVDNTKNVTGVSYSTPAMALSRKCDSSKIKDTINFQSRIKLGEETVTQTLPVQPQGPKPMYLNDVKLEALDDSKTNPPPQSFLQKYWYIVVFLMVYMIIGGREEPAAKGGTAASSAKK